MTERKRQVLLTGKPQPVRKIPVLCFRYVDSRLQSLVDTLSSYSNISYLSLSGNVMSSLQVEVKPKLSLDLSPRYRTVPDSKYVLSVGFNNGHSQQRLCGSVHLSYHLLNHSQGHNIKDK